MPVLLHSVPQRLPSCILAAEYLKRGTAAVINPFDAPLARRCAILENICRLSAGLGCLCHHGSGSLRITQASPRSRACCPASVRWIGHRVPCPCLLSVGEQMQPCATAFELPGGYLRVLIPY